jgi:large subunit ribosomal protein L3
MAKLSRPRRGSLQYWPRKRSKKALPSVSWTKISSENNSKKLMGFIGYKVGMKSAYVKDLTSDSMTKNKRIAVPATIIECPAMKILSARFYKYGIVVNEVLALNPDKELKRKIKLPKKYSKKIDDIKDYDDIRVIVYSAVKNTGIKKSPDISEIALGGSLEDKLNFVKEYLNKEIRINDIFDKMQLVDIRGVTKGKGLEGAVKRFGIGLRSHKAEKGRRRPGSLGPWHPARVTFRTPMAGQLGMFVRPVLNSKVIDISNIQEKNINPSSGFKNFGNIKTDYIILAGSVQGPPKRQIILTQPVRKTKKTEKKNYELIELR